MVSGREEIAQFLVDHEAELNFVDFIGMTPLHYAVENGCQIWNKNSCRSKT